MMIFMAERDPREVARGQMKDLETEGLQVSVASGQAPSVFAGLEALEFLQSGGFVAIAGDLAWTEQRRRAKVSLFGHEARLPAAPHLLALLSGAPLITVFSVRRAKGAYHFIVSKPRKVTAKGGVHRQLAVERSARAYARELEIVVRQHPWQWHIFESILGPPLVGEELGGALLGAEVSDGQDG
jgi:lauroyl/myristoyl acyltransferase